MEKWRGEEPVVSAEPNNVESAVSQPERSLVPDSRPALAVETVAQPTNTTATEQAGAPIITNSVAPELNLDEPDATNLEASLGELIEANGRQE